MEALDAEAEAALDADAEAALEEDAEAALEVDADTDLKGDSSSNAAKQKLHRMYVSLLNDLASSCPALES